MTLILTPTQHSLWDEWLDDVKSDEAARLHFDEIARQDQRCFDAKIDRYGDFTGEQDED